MCTECEECHWLHFSKGQAEAHVLRDVRQDARCSSFGQIEWPLRGQHQILIHNQNPLSRSRLRNICEHARPGSSPSYCQCSVQCKNISAIFNQISFAPLSAKLNQFSKLRGRSQQNNRSKSLKKRAKKGPGYSGKRQPPLCQGEWATHQSSRGPRQHALKPERKFLKEIVSFDAGGQLR